MSDRTESRYASNQQHDDTVKAVANVFDRDAGRYERLLPSHISVDAFRQAFLTSVQRNPKLLQADRGSFWLALQQAASDGLLCDNREAALVIFSAEEDDEDSGERKTAPPARSGKPKQVVYMPMVRGLRKLIRNTGLVTTVETELIFKGEVIEIWRQDGERHFKHVVDTSPDADRSDKSIIGAYALVNYKDGSYQVEWMSRAEIEKVRGVSRAKKGSAPWQAWFGEMARKTVLRRLTKQLDMSPENNAFEKAIERDPTLNDTIEGEATEIAEGIAPRSADMPTPLRQQPEPANKPVTTRPLQEPDPDDWRQNHGETTRDVAAATKRSAPPPVEIVKPAPPPKQEAPAKQPEPTTIEDGGFEAWLIDATGNETTVDPYTDAVQFASAVNALCQGQSYDVMAKIMDYNEGAIGDACEASEQARTVLLGIRTKNVDEGAQETAAADGQQRIVIEVLPVPTTPRGQPHWPNYVIAAKARLDQCQSMEEALAWLEANKPTYVLKNILAETTIDRYMAETIAPKFTTQSAPADEQPSEPDKVLFDLYVSQIKACQTRTELTGFGDRPEVSATLAKWQKERPELMDSLATIARDRRKALPAEAGGLATS